MLEVFEWLESEEHLQAWPNWALLPPPGVVIEGAPSREGHVGRLPGGLREG